VNCNKTRLVVKIVASIVVGAIPVLYFYEEDIQSGAIIGALWAIAMFLVVTAIYMRTEKHELIALPKAPAIESTVIDYRDSSPFEWEEFKDTLSQVKIQAQNTSDAKKRQKLAELFVHMLPEYEQLVKTYEFRIPDSEKVDTLRELQECSALLGNKNRP